MLGDQKRLEVAVAEAPEELAQTGERRPDNLSRVEAQVGEYSTVLAEETGKCTFVFLSVIARIKDAEIAHPDHIVNEPGTTLTVRLAEEVLVFEPEVVLEGEHSGGGEAAHTQTLQCLNDRLAPGRWQISQHVVIIHHLPKSQSANEIMPVHMRHTEDGIEQGVWITKRCFRLRCQRCCWSRRWR